MSSNLI